MRVSEQYLEWFRERYRRAGRKRKKELLDEFCEFTGWHRKAAIRALGKRRAQTYVPDICPQGIRGNSSSEHLIAQEQSSVSLCTWDS